MKKLLLLYVMGLYGLCGQAQSSHLTFMGIPMNERLETFMQKLRAKGFVGEYQEDSFGGAILTEMKGSYRGKPVKLSFNMTPKSKLVCEVHMALDKPNVKEAEAREIFKVWKQLVPNPGPLIISDFRRKRSDYAEWLLSKIDTEIGDVSLYFGYTQKGNIKSNFYVRIDFTDAQTFAKFMSEDLIEIDDGNTITSATESSEKRELIIVEPPFPPKEVFHIISTFIPEGGSNDNNPIYPPSPKPSIPKPGPVPPTPKPHHWGHVRVENDSTDVLIEINAIDFIRHLFLSNDYNGVKQMVLSTPSLGFKKTEEKKDYFVASRTKGEYEELWLSRKDKKSNIINVLRITVKQWEESEIVKYLTDMGYQEVSQKKEDILGDSAITRTYSNGDASHYIDFFFLKGAVPIKSIIFNRK